MVNNDQINDQIDNPPAIAGGQGRIICMPSYDAAIAVLTCCACAVGMLAGLISGIITNVTNVTK